MLQFLAGGLGIGLAVSGTAVAQSPAARLRGVQALTAEEARGVVPAGAVARGQMPMSNPTQPPAAAPSQGGVLSQPRLFSGGPSVFEQRQPTTAPPTGVQPAAGYPAGTMHAPPTYTGAVFQPPQTSDGGLFPSPQPDDPLFGMPCPPGAGATSAMNKWTISADYLWWWTRSATLPALITTSTPLDQGIIGNPTTRVLFGNTSFGNTQHSGGRFGVGYWFGCEQRWGIEVGGFFLDTNGATYTANTSQFAVLARPFVNLNANQQTAEQVATPLRGAVGGATVNYENSLWGLDLNLRRFVTKTNCARLDFLAGFRYLSHEEGLVISENFRRTGPGFDPTGTIDQMTLDQLNAPLPMEGTITDSFRTTNRFYGGQVGLSGEVRRGRWFTNLTGKAAFGTVFQTVSIYGDQQVTMANGVPATATGGLLALPGANIGEFKRNKFAVAPEVGLNIGYHLTPHCRVYVGYTFLYLSNVLRPGDQIDTGLDVTRIPFFDANSTNVPGIMGATRLPQARPTVPFKDSDFFAQGVNVGLQFTW